MDGRKNSWSAQHTSTIEHWSLHHWRTSQCDEKEWLSGSWTVLWNTKPQYPAWSVQAQWFSHRSEDIHNIEWGQFMDKELLKLLCFNVIKEPSTSTDLSNQHLRKRCYCLMVQMALTTANLSAFLHKGTCCSVTSKFPFQLTFLHSIKCMSTFGWYTLHQ